MLLRWEPFCWPVISQSTLPCWGMFVAAVSHADRPAARQAGFRLILECAAAWTGLEWLRELVFTGFGWNGLGVALVDWPLAQTAEWFGVTGLSFFVAAAAVAMSVAIRSALRARNWMAAAKSAELWVVVCMLVVLSFAGWGLGRDVESPLPATGRALRIALVQPNIPQEVKIDSDYLESIANTLSRLTDARLARGPVDLLVWPESTLPASFHDPFTKSFLEHVAGRGNFTLVTGIDEQEMTQYFNSVAVLRGDPFRAELHRKVHLVPFGEYLPLRPIFKHFDFVASRLPGDFDAGESTNPVRVAERGMSLIPLVCFEDTVGRLTRKFVRDEPQLLVNVTNDAWFQDSEEAEQHLANARFRCIELRRPMARAANTGVTCFIDRSGRVTHRLPQWEEGVLNIEMAVPGEVISTVYSQIGDVFSATMLAIGAITGVQGLIRRRRRMAAGKENE